MCAALAGFSGGVSERFDIVQGTWGTLAVARREAEDAIVHEAGLLSVVVGNPALSSKAAPDGRAGNLGLPGHRRAFHSAVAREAAGAVGLPGLLDGAFSLLVVDERDGGSIRLITDRLGFVPTFAAAGWWGTDVDALALAASVAGELDLVSATDFLRHGTMTYPWTLYRRIEQMAPGTVHTLGTTARAREAPTVDRSAQNYWLPREGERFDDFGTAVRELRGTTEEDVATASHGFDQIGVLLSGGEDSRALLGAVPLGPTVNAVSFADWESREVRIARTVAHTCGASFALGLRSPDQYADAFPATSLLVGSCHHFVNVHSFGLHRTLGLPELPMVLGGYSADVLLKGLYSRTRRRPEGKAGWMDSGPFRHEIVAEVRERRGAHRERLHAFRPHSADEWSVLWPFSMRPASGDLQANLRLFQTHEIFHSTRVLEVAARAPAEWKLSRRLFLDAVRPFLSRTRLLPHATSLRFPRLPRAVNPALALRLGLARGAGALLRGEARRGQGSWPSPGKLADTLESRMAARGRDLVSGLRDSPLGDVLARNPTATGPGEGGWPVLQRLALLQLDRILDRSIGAPGEV